MNSPQSQTLRLIFPQWQGGNNPPYYFGAKLLAWLAPEHNGPQEEVPVMPFDGTPLCVEEGVVAKSTLVAQQRAARQLIDKHAPERIVVLGGDCLVDLAPFAYLNERYDGNLAVLWIDSHPDISTAAQLPHGHAMVLANLLGESEHALANEVKVALKPQNVMYVGVHSPSAWEAGEMARLGLKNVSPTMLTREGSRPVLEWFKATGARHLAVHFDLDVLDPALFRAQLMQNPAGLDPSLDGVARGTLSMVQVIALLNDVAQVADVVGIGIAEHLPWDAINLQQMLTQLPLIGEPR